MTCRARVYTFSTRAISHRADIPHAIIVPGRFRRNDDHWVALTVNVNITDLDRGEWIRKVNYARGYDSWTESQLCALHRQARFAPASFSICRVINSRAQRTTQQ